MISYTDESDKSQNGFFVYLAVDVWSSMFSGIELSSEEITSE